jgi:CheY-like chemotaxis protein
MMQGTIEFESELSKGSKFWFQIPFRKKVLPAIEASPDDSAGASLLLPDELISGKKILVVEDNNVVRKIVCKQLKSLRLDCGAAADGTSAIAEFKTGQYDAILLDIQLPDMNGFDVAKVIRQLENSRGVEANSGIPIIALTAGAMEGSREQALEAGLDDYLAKPAGVESISRVLSVWLAAKRTVRLNFLPQ